MFCFVFFLVISAVFLPKNTIPFIHNFNISKSIKRITLIQVINLLLFSLGMSYIYVIWLSIVMLNIIKK